MTTKILLSEKEIPTKWYNIFPDLLVPMEPVLHPATGKQLGPDDLSPIFPRGLIMQEVSPEKFIEIPEEVLNIYKLWRPSPMFRAYRLEKLKIYN